MASLLIITLAISIIIIEVKGDVGRFTPVEPAVNHLKRFGVKLAFEIPKLINFFSGFAGKILLDFTQVLFLHANVILIFIFVIFT